jgi:hypothetical protein
MAAVLVLSSTARVASMTGIFINYRRDDAPGVAGRLYDHLAKSFSRRDLFIDVDAIKPGLDFVKQLDTQVSQCDVLLALIGPHWLKAEDEQGGQRLQGDRDYVRIEIAAALKRDIPVIPVLINGADMPVEDQLPEDLRSLSRRHALELRHTRFAADADAIAAALKDALPKRKTRWPYMAAAACLVAAIGLGAALYLWRAPTPPDNPMKVPPAPAADNSASQPAGQTLTLDDAKRKIAEAKRKIAEVEGKTSLSQPETPSPSTPDAKPAPGIEGVSVALGAPFDSVRAAYPAAADSGAGDLLMPLDGINFYFTKDDRVLREVMFEAPFAGSVRGVHLGDLAKDVITRLGQPYTAFTSPSPTGDVTAFYYHVDGNDLRFNIDKSDKVDTIFEYLKR